MSYNEINPYWKSQAESVINIINNSKITYNPTTCCYTPALLYPKSITPLSDPTPFKFDLTDFKIMFYIHIPFCSRRCSFCPFFVQVADTVSDNYLDLIIMQLEQIIKETKLPKEYTVSIGGGSPNLLRFDQLKKILSVFDRNHIDICTMEVHPECNQEPDYFFNLLEAGINRVSVGFQSSDNEVLKLSTRGHDSEAMKIIATSVMPTPLFLNVDIMYGGMYGETVENAYKSFEYVFKTLRPESISAYRACIHDGTPEKKRYLIKPNNYPNTQEIITIASMIHNVASDNGYIYTGDGFFYRERINQEGKRNQKNGVLGVGPGTYSWAIDGICNEGFISFAPYDIDKYSELLHNNCIPVERNLFFDPSYIKRMEMIFDLKRSNYIVKNLPDNVLKIMNNLSIMGLIHDMGSGFAISDSGKLIEDLIFALLLPINMWDEFSILRKKDTIPRHERVFDWFFDPDVVIQFLKFTEEFI